MKKRFYSTLMAAGLAFSLCAVTASPVMAMTAQQEKMASCNKSATGKTGDERKAFMSSCLKAQPAAATAPVTQQQRMKDCNASATGKSGDERKAFMKACLSGRAAATPAK